MKTSLALRDIVSRLEADLDWLTPDARSQFHARMRRERDEALVVLLSCAPAACDVAAVKRAVVGLRGDRGAQRLALADRLEDRLARVPRDPAPARSAG